jgi:putative flavoprotein involved in K+ transport
MAFGDARYQDVRQLIQKHCADSGATMPDLPDPPPFLADAPESVALARLGSAIFTSGFRPDYASWIDLPAFDDMGFPVHRDGASTDFPGLYFVGVHFLRKRKSSLLIGVGEDAAIVASHAAAASANRRTTGDLAD